MNFFKGFQSKLFVGSECTNLIMHWLKSNVAQVRKLAENRGVH